MLGPYQDPQAATWSRISEDPKVPEAIRTSARDALARHIASARKAGVSPFAYKGGAEVAEQNNMLAPQSREDRTVTPEPQPTEPGWFSKMMSAPNLSDLLPSSGVLRPYLDSGIERNQGNLAQARREQEIAVDPRVRPTTYGDVPIARDRAQEIAAKGGLEAPEQSAAAQEVPVGGRPPAWMAPRAANDMPDTSAPIPATKPRPPVASGGLEAAPSAPSPVPEPAKAAGGLEAAAAPSPTAKPATAPIEGAIRKPPAFDPGESDVEKPSTMDPLAYALMRGGFALMASDKPFAQALGDAGIVGVDSYVQGQDNRDQKQREYEKQVRDENEEKRRAYEDTELAPWVAEQNVFDQDRTYNRNVYQEDRDYDRGVVTSDRDYGLNKQQVGIQGARLGIEGQRLNLDRDRMGLEQEQLGIARAGLEPQDMRMLNSLADRFQRLDPNITPDQAFQLAIEQFKQLNPSPSYGFNIPGLNTAPQEIPDNALGGAVR